MAKSKVFRLSHIVALEEAHRARLGRGRPGIGTELAALIREYSDEGVTGTDDDAFAHVAQLCRIQKRIQKDRRVRGLDSIGARVEELIARLTSGGVAGKEEAGTLEEIVRIAQAKRFWDLGVGRERGFKTFEDYLLGDKSRGLAPIPELSLFHSAFAAANGLQLVLMEPRIGLTKLCKLGNIEFNGSDETFVAYDKRHAEFTEPTWIFVQDGRDNHNRRPSDCRRSFAKDELGLTALQGVCMYIQHPSVLVDLNGPEGHAMDLPGSVHREGRGDYACLGVRGGRARLIWDWYGGAVPGYGSASRRECKPSVL